MKLLMTSCLALQFSCLALAGAQESTKATWEVLYDLATGLPKTETLLVDGQPLEISTLVFEGRQLVKRSLRDSTGDLKFTDTLSYWPDGRLRRLERDGNDGPLAQQAWSYGPDGKRSSSWSLDSKEPSGAHHEWAYTVEKTAESLVKGTEVLLTRLTQWFPDGSSQETQTDLVGGQVVKRVMDSQGRALEEVISSKEKTLLTRKWVRDDHGRVSQTSETKGTTVELWTYQYDDKTTNASLTRDGVPIRDEVIDDGEKVQVRWYDHGTLFLVESLHQGRVVKQTYYDKGVVVRERVP